MKYRLVSDAVSTLVSMIPEAMAASVHTRMGNMPMVLVPIPLAPRRRKLRGFNQAELIAKALGRRWGVPLNTTLLRRVKETIPQVTVEKRDVRFQNMKNAFFAERMKRCDYGVMLCDDVYTTGATKFTYRKNGRHCGGGSARQMHAFLHHQSRLYGGGR